VAGQLGRVERTEGGLERRGVARDDLPAPAGRPHRLQPHGAAREQERPRAARVLQREGGEPGEGGAVVTWVPMAGVTFGADKRLWTRIEGVVLKVQAAAMVAAAGAILAILVRHMVEGAASAAAAWRASMQTTGQPCARSPASSQDEVDPASMPMRSRGRPLSRSACPIASGSEATVASFAIAPSRSTMQRDVLRSEISRPQ
jgi:hypothetical protein